MMVSQHESDILNINKCALCIGVVVIHSKLPMEMIQDYANYELFQYVFARLIVGRLCVPFFLVLSGFFFFTKLEEKVSVHYFEDKIKSRLKSVLIPYLIGNTLTLLFLLLLRYLGRNNLEGYDSFVSCYWGHPKHGLPVDMPLWYLRDLMVISLLSPLLYYIIKKVGLLFLFLLGVLWYVDLQIPYNIIYESFGSLLFFSIGAFCAINKIGLVPYFARRNVGSPLLLAYVICLVTASFTRNEYCAKTLSLLSIPSVIYLTTHLYKMRLAKCTTRGKFDKGLVTATFFVFLYHFYLPAPATHIVAIIISKVSVDASLFFRLCLSVLEKTAYLLILYNILKRFSPRVTSLIVGGRL